MWKVKNNLKKLIEYVNDENKNNDEYIEKFSFLRTIIIWYNIACTVLN